MRRVKETLAKGQPVDIQSFDTPEHHRVYQWMREQERAYLQDTSIIQLREAFMAQHS
jgi:hypothetical protein